MAAIDAPARCIVDSQRLGSDHEPDTIAATLPLRATRPATVTSDHAVPAVGTLVGHTLTPKAATAISLMLMALASGLIELVGDPLKGVLAFQREAVRDGEWWRLMTGHLVHLGPHHTVLNVAALLALGWLLSWRPLGWARFATVSLITALGVGLLLLIANPSVTYYVGLSGWLHGLAVLVATAHWRADRLMSLILAFGLIAKLSWEVVYGANPATEAAIGGRIVCEAHRYGAVSAVLGLLLTAAPSRLLDRQG